MSNFYKEEEFTLNSMIKKMFRSLGILFVIALIIAIASCKAPISPKAPQPARSIEETSPSITASVSAISNDIEEAKSIDTDLNLQELEGLDNELEDLNSLQ